MSELLNLLQPLFQKQFAFLLILQYPRSEGHNIFDFEEGMEQPNGQKEKNSES
jgi:hypothetical protein